MTGNLFSSSICIFPNNLPNKYFTIIELFQLISILSANQFLIANDSLSSLQCLFPMFVNDHINLLFFKSNTSSLLHMWTLRSSFFGLRFIQSGYSDSLIKTIVSV